MMGRGAGVESAEGAVFLTFGWFSSGRQGARLTVQSGDAMRHIISLSTIPPRFGQIGPVLASLLAQRVRAEEIRLYVPRRYRRFPGYAGQLPDVPDGVTIVQVDDDLGPATKVLYAARDLRGQSVDILYCDDDHVYLPGWSARLLQARAVHPEAAVTSSSRSVVSLTLPEYDAKPMPRVIPAPPLREQAWGQVRRLWSERPRRDPAALVLWPQCRFVRRAGYADIAEGFCGVAIRPDFLDEAAFDVPSVLWSVDDIWLSGMMARREIPIWALAGKTQSRLIVSVSSHHPLYAVKVEGQGRRAANLACARYLQKTYGIWGGAG